MNQLKDYILETGTLLYRYDLKEPPKEWSTIFKNPEYVYSNLGVKNQVGAFFFLDSLQQAANTAKCAVQRYQDKNFDGIWITQCMIKKPIKLLDLRDASFCIELLAALDKSGYDILTGDFRTWEGMPFSEMKRSIYPIEEILLDSSWLHNPQKHNRVGAATKEVEDVLGFPTDCIGRLCQLFTDFNNGVHFKSLLEKRGYEGYIYNELSFSIYDHPRGTNTICVFVSNKFDSPQIIAVKKIYH